MKSNFCLRNVFIFSLVICMAAMSGLLPVGLSADKGLGEAHAGVVTGFIGADSVGEEGAAQGEKSVSIRFEISNGRSKSITLSNIKASGDGDGITIIGIPSSLTVESNKTAELPITVDVSKSAGVGNRLIGFTADIEGESPLSKSISFEVYEKRAVDNNDTKALAAIDITHYIDPKTGFTIGNDNVLKIKLFNYGNSTIKDTKVSVTLPAEMSVYNGSNTESIGYLSVGSSKTFEVPITVASNAASKNYGIEVEVSGLDYSSNQISAKKTFYIPVQGDGSISSDNIAITNVSIPDEINSGTPFNLSFTVQNTGASEIKNVKVSVEPAEGIINKSRNIFIDNIPKGGSKQYTVKLYSFDGADQKSYPIKITAAPTNTSEKDTESGVSQYATVTILSDGSTAKKPQLMIDNYSYGGSVVQAGTDFYLNIGLFNTSGKTLTNVKVSLTNEDGVFVPVGGSNSFFVDSIKAKGHYTKSIRLSTKPQAEQKTTPITVKMTYEAGSGDPLEADDVIAIPVTQRTRLVVDEIVPPTEVYVGQQGTCELEFYNMGKTVLSNLRINCEGNFDVMESNSYYAGNMESGKSDSYRFNYIPREVGPMEGTITFTYEDGNGDPQFLEVPFTFQVMEAPVYDEENPEEMQPEKQKPWALIIAGAVIVAGIVAGVLFKRHRKKKLNAALEIEDDFDIDLAETVDNTKKPESK